MLRYAEKKIKNKKTSGTHMFAIFAGWSGEEGIGDSVRPKNKFESQGESIQDSCKTSNDVRC